MPTQDYRVKVEELPGLLPVMKCPSGCGRTATHWVRNVLGYVVQIGCKQCSTMCALRVSDAYADLARIVKGQTFVRTSHQDGNFDVHFDEGTGREYLRERDYMNNERRERLRRAAEEAMKKWQDHM